MCLGCSHPLAAANATSSGHPLRLWLCGAQASATLQVLWATRGRSPLGSGGVFSFSLLPQNDKHEGCGPPPPPHLAHSGHAHAGVALSQPPGAFVPCRVQQCLACTPFLGPRIRNGRGAHQRTSVLPSRLVGWELEITQKKLVMAHASPEVCNSSSPIVSRIRIRVGFLSTTTITSRPRKLCKGRTKNPPGPAGRGHSPGTRVRGGE